METLGKWGSAPSVRRFQKRMRSLFRFVSNLQHILLYVGNEQCVVVKSRVLTSSIATSSHIQPLQIQDLLQRISNGRLLLPNIEGLRMGQEARMTEQLSELELTNLMINMNHILAILGHLQGVIRDLRTVQTQEYSHHLTTGGKLALLEMVTTQVAERTLDQEFSDLSLSCVDTELEDFGEMSNQEGSE